MELSIIFLESSKMIYTSYSCTTTGDIGGFIFYILEVFTTGGVAGGVIYYFLEILQNELHRWSSLTTVEYPTPSE
jgi:hypothetical protein